MWNGTNFAKRRYWSTRYNMGEVRLLVWIWVQMRNSEECYWLYALSKAYSLEKKMDKWEDSSGSQSIGKGDKREIFKARRLVDLVMKFTLDMVFKASCVLFASLGKNTVIQIKNQTKKTKNIITFGLHLDTISSLTYTSIRCGKIPTGKWVKESILTRFSSQL